MTIIGTLKKQADGSYKGELATIAVRSKVTMRPVEARTNGGPAFRVFAGLGECGAAFAQTARSTGVDYLSLKLDDPTFAAPIYVAAFENRDDADTLDLVWSRNASRE